MCAYRLAANLLYESNVIVSCRDNFPLHYLVFLRFTLRHHERPFYMQIWNNYRIVVKYWCQRGWHQVESREYIGMSDAPHLLQVNRACCAPKPYGDMKIDLLFIQSSESWKTVRNSRLIVLMRYSDSKGLRIEAQDGEPDKRDYCQEKKTLG